MLKMKKTGFLLFAFLMCGCECKEPEEPKQIEWFLSFLSNAPFVESDDYPEWVLAKMDEISIVWPDDMSVKISMFRGERYDRTLYLITGTVYNDPIMYYENGDRLIFGDAKGLSDFCDTSTNWIKIFDYGKRTMAI
jgi:hypothetical protein